MRQMLGSILLVFMLFSSNVNGILELCVDPYGHLALELQSDACPVENQEYRGCAESVPHYDDPAKVHNSETDCRDTGFNVGIYLVVNSHVQCHCCSIPSEVVKYSAFADSYKEISSLLLSPASDSDGHAHSIASTSKTVLLI